MLLASQGSDTAREEIQPRELLPLFPKPQLHCPAQTLVREAAASLRNTRTGKISLAGEGPRQGLALRDLNKQKWHLGPCWSLLSGEVGTREPISICSPAISISLSLGSLGLFRESERGGRKLSAHGSS